MNLSGKGLIGVKAKTKEEGFVLLNFLGNIVDGNNPLKGIACDINNMLELYDTYVVEVTGEDECKTDHEKIMKSFRHIGDDGYSDIFAPGQKISIKLGYSIPDYGPHVDNTDPDVITSKEFDTYQKNNGTIIGDTWIIEREKDEMDLWDLERIRDKLNLL